MSVLLTKYNAIDVSNTEPISLTYQLDKRCKNLPEKVSLPYFIKALDMQKAISEDYRARATNRNRFQRFCILDIQPRAYARGLFHLIRDGDIFREFLIYIPLENCVTPISLFTYTPQAFIRNRLSCLFFVKYIPYISIHSILKPPPRIENENSIGFCFTVGFDTCNYSGITNNNLL